MRQCPNCGYRDPPYWRSARHRYVSDICHISDLEFNDPKLAKKIKILGRAPNYYENGNYFYRLTKGNKVERTHKDDMVALKSGFYEKSEWKDRDIAHLVCHKLDEFLEVKP